MANSRTRKNTNDQTALDERVVEDQLLERALENREKAKDAKGEAAKTFKTKDEVVKDKLAELGIEEGGAPVRIGRFRIERSPVAAKDVAFTTDPSSRLKIKPVPAEEL